MCIFASIQSSSFSLRCIAAYFVGLQPPVHELNCVTPLTGMCFGLCIALLGLCVRTLDKRTRDLLVEK